MTTIRWRKAMASSSNSQCVELAEAGPDVLMRNSRHPDQGYFTIPRAELADLIEGAKAGEFDDFTI
jgi:hypothetical protein